MAKGSKIVAILTMLEEWWQQIKIAIGLIERAQHEHRQEEIDEATKIVNDPNSTEEARREAVKKLQDIANRRARQ